MRLVVGSMEGYLSGGSSSNIARSVSARRPDPTVVEGWPWLAPKEKALHKHLPRLFIGSNSRVAAAWPQDLAITKPGHKPRPSMYVKHMDIVKAILSSVDLNAPWIHPRMTWELWLRKVALFATWELRRPDLVRSRYYGRASELRQYDTAEVTPAMVEDVQHWIGGLGVKLYTSGFETCDVQATEAVPTCPGCHRRLSIMWCRDYNRNGWNAIWGCPNPNYDLDCREVAYRVWRGVYPSVLSVGEGHGITFTRDWALFGQFPPERFRTTPSQWMSVAVDEYEASVSRILRGEQEPAPIGGTHESTTAVQG